MQPIDMVFLVAITEFLKQQFGTTGKATMWLAFGVGLVLWAVPLVAEVYPDAKLIIDSFFMFLKVFLSGMGAADFVKSNLRPETIIR